MRFPLTHAGLGTPMCSLLSVLHADVSLLVTCNVSRHVL